MTASASKLVKTLKLRGAGKIDNKALAAGALTARTNLSADSAENELNLERLLKAKEVFAKADEDKGGSLDVNEFVTAFKGVLKTDEGDGPDALRRLFARIDANADGTVDWREFSTYTLLENDSAASLRGEEESTSYGAPVEPEDLSGHRRHGHMITNIISLPAKGHLKERYVTTGKDGTFRFWQAKGMEICGSIPELAHTPVCMDCWRRPSSATEEVLAVGDIGGYVTLFNLAENASEPKRSENRWGLRQVWRQLLHTDWICQLQYVSELNSILSCSLDKRLCLADVEARVTVKYLEGHTQGVRAVDWSRAYSFIASGGLDRNVMLWNPFQLHSMATLTGHAAAVTHITINERSSQIISLSADKVIKVWDIRNNRCLQTLTDKQKHRPEDALTCLMYDPQQKQLLSGSVLPKAWRAIHLKPDSSLRRHAHPVCQLAYNSVYQEAISADESGLICVWKVSTGALRVRWARAHDDARITSMAFDLNFRRLITGCENGGVKIWNFSSGECLKELQAISNQEITGIICLSGDHTLVTGGYDGLIVVWNTDSGAVSAHLAPPGLSHASLQERSIEQVMFIGKRLPYVLAAVSADGFLRLWNVKQVQLVMEVQVSQDSGLTAVCVDPAQTLLVVSDSAGFIYTYNIAAWKGGKGKYQGVQSIAQWEAHEGSISALQWMQHGPPPGKGFITSASSDKGLALWSSTGAHVGDFGQNQQWDFDDTATWRSSVASPVVPLPSFQPAVQTAAVQHLEDVVQQADLLDAAVGSLLCEASRHSDVSSVYSSGDEMLPECFVEPDADS
ncbi:MAG: hypothetical protein FRX49_03249 [Trebouxia sp. A1-2]|nr:MAG: hypothetical protein FRX49_03249 [Trebouxia sp. A1-2]